MSQSPLVLLRSNVLSLVLLLDVIVLRHHHMLLRYVGLIHHRPSRLLSLHVHRLRLIHLLLGIVAWCRSIEMRLRMVGVISVFLTKFLMCRGSNDCCCDCCGWTINSPSSITKSKNKKWTNYAAADRSANSNPYYIIYFFSLGILCRFGDLVLVVAWAATCCASAKWL